jgi:hypothetical protein
MVHFCSNLCWNKTLSHKVLTARSEFRASASKLVVIAAPGYRGLMPWRKLQIEIEENCFTACKGLRKNGTEIDYVLRFTLSSDSPSDVQPPDSTEMSLLNQPPCWRWMVGFKILTRIRDVRHENVVQILRTRQSLNEMNRTNTCNDNKSISRYQPVSENS